MIPEAKSTYSFWREAVITPAACQKNLQAIDTCMVPESIKVAAVASPMTAPANLFSRRKDFKENTALILNCLQHLQEYTTASNLP